MLENLGALRTHLSTALTAGVAIAGVGLITAVPAAPALPQTPPPAITLVAGDTPWLSIPLLTVDVDQIVDRLGIGDQTIAGLLEQTGVAEQSLAAVAIGLLNAAGFDSDSSVLDVLNIPPTLTVGDSLTQLVDTMFGGGVTVTGMIQQLFGGDATLGDLVTAQLDSLGIGQKTLVDLVSGTPTGEMTVEQLIVNMLVQNGDQSPAQLLAADPSLANTTLGEILQSLPPTSNTIPGAYDSLADQPIQVLLSSDEAGDLGGQNIRQLAGDQIPPGIAGTVVCNTVVAAMGLDCSATLNSYLGDNTVLQTAQGLHTTTDSPWDPSVHAGTPLADITVGNLLNGTGPFASMPLSEVITGLHLSTPTLAGLLTDLGFADKNIDTLLTDSFPLLFNTSLLKVLDAWGLGTLQVDTVIDRMGLDLPVVTALSRLGLGDVPVDSVLDDLIGGTTVGNIVNDLGFGGTSIDSLVDSLGIADSNLFTVFLEFTGLLPSIEIGLPA